MTVEAAVRRARRGRKERGRKPGDQTERGGGRRKENEGEEVHPLFKYLSVGSTRTRRNGCAGGGPK